MRFNLYINTFGAANAVQKGIVNRRIARDFGDRSRVNRRFEVREKAPRRVIKSSEDLLSEGMQKEGVLPSQRAIEKKECES